MRKFVRSAVLAGAVAIATVGTAMAASQNSRMMTVELPDGSVARISYQGDVPPQVVVEPAFEFVPVRTAAPVTVSPFALLNRIAADMDRQMATMIRQADSLDVLATEGSDFDGSARPPAGAVSYRFVSARSGDSICTRSVRITSLGADRQPKVVSKISGDCAASDDGRVSVPIEPASTVSTANTV